VEELKIIKIIKKPGLKKEVYKVNKDFFSQCFKNAMYLEETY
jgi:DNA-binding transcriptional regulator GbsR (MarR family)